MVPGKDRHFVHNLLNIKELNFYFSCDANADTNKCEVLFVYLYPYIPLLLVATPLIDEAGDSSKL